MEKDLYNFLAADFDRKKRSKPWKDLETFVKEINDKEISFTGYNIDLGCANGRNFSAFIQPNNRLIGVDNSFEFLKIAKEV